VPADLAQENPALAHVAPTTKPAAALAALGIVYGDLGTSPLYTLQAVVGSDFPKSEPFLFGSATGLPKNPVPQQYKYIISSRLGAVQNSAPVVLTQEGQFRCG
jgi:potassium transporter